MFRVPRLILWVALALAIGGYSYFTRQEDSAPPTKPPLYSAEFVKGFDLACEGIVLQDWELNELGLSKTWAERIDLLRERYLIPKPDDPK